ncbi:DUF3857 domain-containing protein [Winogradskyella immobilis]|uniref:DUF3857 domain-containing protein n=1 Tax=Winogradskyella immobilis TaxID=2816852 RepID=A0ABS8ELH1_9FLAO|nr:DUF3857 domain-containing protein [Winogradskyella immobilis]MCC1483876.1 DUF3857 domain-containing protein [Winogradskyella immobilis]MCG0015969.1 DUF3857 domain-containing protein [Winogradskyella immobilis]
MPHLKSKLLLIYVLLSTSIFSQSDNDFIAILAPAELKEKANAIVRYDKQVVEINAYNRMIVTTNRVVTIYNKYGDRSHNAYEAYDPNTKIKKMEVRIYDAAGKEIKKIKTSDFADESAVSGGTLYSDSRVKYLNYTPIKYPYTIHYKSEVEMRSTAFVPQWRPIDGYYLAVQYSEFKIINNSGVEVRTKNENFEAYGIENLGESHVSAKNLKAIKYETYSSDIGDITPCLKSALTTFDMEGVKGENNNWEDFGKWMHTKLLMGTDDLPQSAIDEVKALTANTEDKIERAKIVYKYMQDKTRYISVQVGIGGWKPMLANEVDKLGYADCKGLTNYTKALLEVVDVPSYYTVVWGDQNIRDIDSDFSITEGNHVILCVPNNDENIFLECTSQTNPFGFTAGFTDDRDVLLVTPEGGKIVHTKVYSADESLQLTKANVVLDDMGNFTANISIKTTGYQYDLHEGMETRPLRDQKLHYKEYWNNINNLDITSIDYKNDKDQIELIETLDVSATNYASKSGNRLIIQPNMFNKVTGLPTRYDKRNLDFKIERAFKDVDEFIIELPETLKVEAMSEGAKVNTKYGSYEYALEKLEGNKLKYTRTYIMNKGNYDKEDYEAFRDFRKQIVKHDKTKIVLVK